jgi:hypothetical protein
MLETSYELNKKLKNAHLYTYELVQKKKNSRMHTDYYMFESPKQILLPRKKNSEVVGKP